MIGALYNECFQSVCLRRIREKKSNERDKKRKRERKSIEMRVRRKDSFKTRVLVLFVLFDYSNLIVRVELTKSIKETQ